MHYINALHKNQYLNKSTSPVYVPYISLVYHLYIRFFRLGQVMSGRASCCEVRNGLLGYGRVWCLIFSDLCGEVMHGDAGFGYVRWCKAW